MQLVRDGRQLGKREGSRLHNGVRVRLALLVVARLILGEEVFVLLVLRLGTSSEYGLGSKLTSGGRASRGRAGAFVGED